MQIADEIVLMNNGRDRAGRLAAGSLRAAGERVRADVRRRGDAASAASSCGRTTSCSRRCRRRRARRRSSSGSPTSASRCASSSCARRRRQRFDAQLTHDEAERLELAPGQIVYARSPARRVPGSCRGRPSAVQPCRLRDDSSQPLVRRPGSGSRRARDASGSSPAATSASVTSSSTARMFARSATKTSRSAVAAPCVLELLGPDAAHVRERPLDRADDVGEGDLARAASRASSRPRRRAGSRRCPRA